jgi:acyl-CoA dehydrogenase
MKATIKAGITRYEAALKSETEGSSIGFAVAMNNLKVSASTMAAEIIQMALLITGISGYKNDTPYSVGRHLRDALSAIVMISNDRILSNTSNLLLVSRFDTSLLG